MATETPNHITSLTDIQWDPSQPINAPQWFWPFMAQQKLSVRLSYL